MTHLDTLRLHQLRYGELEGAALASARAHLDVCSTCSSRLRVQEAERSAFVLRPVPPALRNPAAPTRPVWAQLLFGLALAAVVMLAVRLVRTEGEASAASGAAEVAFRGALPEVEVWVRGPEGVRALAPGESLRAGQRVQLKYDPRGNSSVAIAGRDGSGTVEVYTTHAPTGIGLVTAPFALTLDDAGNQELFVVGSTLPLDESAVRIAITRGLADVHVARVSLAKR